MVSDGVFCRKAADAGRLFAAGQSGDSECRRALRPVRRAAPPGRIPPPEAPERLSLSGGGIHPAVRCVLQALSDPRAAEGAGAVRGDRTVCAAAVGPVSPISMSPEAWERDRKTETFQRPLTDD